MGAMVWNRATFTGGGIVEAPSDLLCEPLEVEGALVAALPKLWAVTRV